MNLFFVREYQSAFCLQFYDNRGAVLIQCVESHYKKRKKFLKNVDIMSTSYLTFVPESGFFSTLAQISV
jgi:hypothetical protein